MRSLPALIAIAVVCLSAAPAGGQVPTVLNYQGALTDAGAAVVDDGDYSMTFSLYDVSAGGTPLWTETQTVAVAKGIFNAILGSSVSLDLDFDAQYWLGISVAGEAELTPRIELTAAAYSLSSMNVFGDANVFPSSGYVGIGTTSPSGPLHVEAGTAPQVAIRGGTANPLYSSIYVQAYDTGASPGFGYIRGSMVAHHYVDSNGTWRLRVGAAPRIYVESLGDVGIGVADPLECLDVDGAIRIGAAKGENAGTIRFTGSDFEGYDGSEWKSLTAEGGSGLPSGSSGSTLRHNGSTWEAVQSLYNAGTNIGIGTTSPSAHLDVMGAGTQKIKVETTSATGAAVLGLESTAGANDNFNIAKYGPSAAGTIAGIPTANLSIALTGADAGDLLLGTTRFHKVHIATGGVERMCVDGSDLYLRNSSGETGMLFWTSPYGHNFFLYDDEGTVPCAMESDSDGEGGEMIIFGENSSYTHYFEVDGNYNGTNSPRVSIRGESEAYLDMSETGNASVILPWESIAASEIWNEPGVASYNEGTASVSLTGGGNLDLLGLRTLFLPSNGYALVMGTMQVRVSHNTGIGSSASFGVSDDINSLPLNQDVNVAVPSSAATGLYDFPVTVHGLFRLLTDDPVPFYLLGRGGSGTFTVFDVQLTIVFVQSAYGTTDEMLAGTESIQDDDAPRRVLSSADMERERIESMRANEERMQREIDELRAEIELIKTRSGDNER
jgi:hypothetical protein